MQNPISIQQARVIIFTCVLLLNVAVPAFSKNSEVYKIRDLYSKGEISSLTSESIGKAISISGYMAPPLLPELDFFILTKMPLAVCPFCEPEMEWPDNLVFVRMDKVVTPVNYRLPIIVTGVVEVGDQIDPETGFFSKVRLVNARYELRDR